MGEVLQGEISQKQQVQLSDYKFSPNYVRRQGFLLSIIIRASKLDAFTKQSSEFNLCFRVQKMLRPFKNGKTHIVNISTCHDQPQPESLLGDHPILATLNGSLDDFSFVIGNSKIKTLPRHKVKRHKWISLVVTCVQGTIKVGHR